LLGAIVWIWALGQFSVTGAIAGIGIGLLLVVAWSLRDGLLQGEPRVALSHRIALAFLGAALAGAVLLWRLGPTIGGTGLGTAAGVFAAWLLFVTWSTARVNRSVLGPLVTRGSGPAGRALVVYHSAHGGLMRAMGEAFAAGLTAERWQVDVSPASELSPVDLHGYQLLLLGSPCYNRGLARPIEAYLDRLGDLQDMPVGLVVTGFNFTERAMVRLRARIQQQHGRVVDEIELWTARPNRERDGTTEAEEIMRRAGARLARTLEAAAA
jgi:hypothetical protein